MLLSTQRISSKWFILGFWIYLVVFLKSFTISATQDEGQARHFISSPLFLNHDIETRELSRFLDRISGGRKLAQQLLSEIWLNQASSNTCVGCKLLVHHIKRIGNNRNQMHSFIGAVCRVARVDLVDENEFCDGLADRLTDHFVYIVCHSKLNAQQMCAQLLNNCAISGQHRIKPLFWEVELRQSSDTQSFPNENYEKPTYHVANSYFSGSNSKESRFLHFTDAHLDALYKEGSLAYCGRVHCCNVQPNMSQVYDPNPSILMDSSTAYYRRTSEKLSTGTTNHSNLGINADLETEKPTLAGFWGNFGSCDLPLSTFHHLLRYLAREKLRNIDYIVYSGDTTASNIWSVTYKQVLFSQTKFLELIKQYLLEDLSRQQSEYPSSYGVINPNFSKFQHLNPKFSSPVQSYPMSLNQGLYKPLSTQPMIFPLYSSAPYSPSPFYKSRTSRSTTPQEFHRIYPQTIQNDVSKKLKGLFIPAIGNHDVETINLFGPTWLNNSLSATKLYQDFYELWKEFIPANQFKNFQRGGYYSISLNRNLRIIVLNTQLCFRLNLWHLVEWDDPGKQLFWLVQELTEAESMNQSVHLVGHIAPDIRSCTSVWLHNFLSICGRYENTIKAQFYGHSHLDEIRLYFSKTPNAKMSQKISLPLTNHAQNPKTKLLRDSMAEKQFLFPKNVEEDPNQDSGNSGIPNLNLVSSTLLENVPTSNANQIKTDIPLNSPMPNNSTEEAKQQNSSNFRTFSESHKLNLTLGLPAHKAQLLSVGIVPRVCSIAFLSPSLSPNGDVNPAFKIFTVGESGFVTNSETYYADVEAANQRHRQNHRQAAVDPAGFGGNSLTRPVYSKPVTFKYRSTLLHESNEDYFGLKPGETPSGLGFRYISQTNQQFRPPHLYDPMPNFFMPGRESSRYAFEQRQQELRWQFAYDLKSSYGLKQQSWEEWLPLVERMRSDTSLFKVYYNNLHRFSNGSRWNSECNSQCMKNLLDSIVVHDLD